jgi:hypothetical protein
VAAEIRQVRCAVASLHTGLRCAKSDSLSADSTDLVKALFLEFALVFSDDWVLLPCDLGAARSRRWPRSSARWPAAT